MMTDQAERLRHMVGGRESFSAPLQSLSARVITVTSGKGGVGKTNLTASLALCFRRLGKRVVIIDADFGLANIELIFGITPVYSLADVLFGDKFITDAISDGPMDVKFISGGSGFRELANISEKQMRCLISNFAYLDAIADIILIDTGAGISKSVINFVKASNETILVTTPEPTSITDAYALIKTVREEGGQLPDFKIVVNRVENAQEGNEIYGKLSRVSKKFIGIDLEHLGSIPYDHNLVRAVKQQKPVTLSFPNTPFSKSLASVSERLLGFNASTNRENDTGMLSFMKRLVHILGG